MVTLRPYQPPSFLTALGAVLKLHQLKKRGFPENLRNWRFLTFTMDRKRFPDPEAAYEKGTARLREAVRILRQGYDIKRWWWKLEFHSADDDGRIYAHWHLLLDYKRPILADAVAAAWGLGRTEIRGVRDSRFHYLFKYVAKGLESVPTWILSRERVRFCQGSRGFFPAHGQRKAKDRPSPRPGSAPPAADTQNNGSSDIKETIGERIERWMRSAVSRTLLERGNPRYHVWQLEDGVTWGGLLVRAARLKLSRPLTDAEFMIETTKIETTEQWITRLPVRYHPAPSRVG